MNSKKNNRMRRARKIRARQLGKMVLRVTRSARHITAQIFNPAGDQVLVSSSSVGKATAVPGYTGNCEAAAFVGKTIAEAALKADIKEVALPALPSILRQTQTGALPAILLATALAGVVALLIGIVLSRMREDAMGIATFALLVGVFTGMLP